MLAVAQSCNTQQAISVKCFKKIGSIVFGNIARCQRFIFFRKIYNINSSYQLISFVCFYRSTHIYVCLRQTDNNVSTSSAIRKMALSNHVTIMIPKRPLLSQKWFCIFCHHKWESSSTKHTFTNTTVATLQGSQGTEYRQPQYVSHVCGTFLSMPGNIGGSDSLHVFHSLDNN